MVVMATARVRLIEVGEPVRVVCGCWNADLCGLMFVVGKQVGQTERRITRTVLI